MAVAMVDLDRFKAINDVHGHAVGDQALVTAGEALRRALRAEDVLGRLGGEEFLALLPDTDEEAAAHAAERLRAAVAARVARCRSRRASATPSWSGDEAPDDLVRRADDGALRGQGRGPEHRPGSCYPATSHMTHDR